MKVYVVMAMEEYEGGSPVGIFSSHELAVEYVEKQERFSGSWMDNDKYVSESLGFDYFTIKVFIIDCFEKGCIEDE